MEDNINPFLLADYHDDDKDVDNNDNKIEDTYSESNNSPKLINIKNDNSWIKELNSYFKLDNLFTCIYNDKNKNVKQKKDMSVSKIIMSNIIDKKLGSFTYHYGNKKSEKGYYTYDYPEIYYNKKLYNNISEWLKEEFSKKI
jgi:hypothetical protein